MNSDSLILVEFLVDQLHIDTALWEDYMAFGNGPICVTFQFLKCPVLSVCEEDFAPRTTCDCPTDKARIRNGKSILFTMTPQQAQECLCKFDVNVVVFKKVTHRKDMTKVNIGRSLISICNLFRELYCEMHRKCEDWPISKVMRESYKVLDKDHLCCIGSIGVYVRLCCFGDRIVTQFQMDMDDHSLQVKPKEGHYLYKTNKKEERDMCGTITSLSNNPVRLYPGVDMIGGMFGLMHTEQMMQMKSNPRLHPPPPPPVDPFAGMTMAEIRVATAPNCPACMRKPAPDMGGPGMDC